MRFIFIQELILDIIVVRTKCPVNWRRAEVGHFAICTGWLGIVDKVKTKILSSNDNIFIPELSLQV